MLVQWPFTSCELIQEQCCGYGIARDPRNIMRTRDSHWVAMFSVAGWRVSDICDPNCISLIVYRKRPGEVGRAMLQWSAIKSGPKKKISFTEHMQFNAAGRGDRFCPTQFNTQFNFKISCNTYTYILMYTKFASYVRRSNCRRRW